MRFFLCSQNQRLTVVDFAGTSVYRNQAVEKQCFVVTTQQVVVEKGLITALLLSTGRDARSTGN